VCGLRARCGFRLFCSVVGRPWGRSGVASLVDVVVVVVVVALL
jgi:hypothetical protein